MNVKEAIYVTQEQNDGLTKICLRILVIKIILLIIGHKKVEKYILTESIAIRLSHNINETRIMPSLLAKHNKNTTWVLDVGDGWAELPHESEVKGSVPPSANCFPSKSLFKGILNYYITYKWRKNTKGVSACCLKSLC